MTAAVLRTGFPAAVVALLGLVFQALAANTEATLITAASQVQPGSTFLAALRLRMDPGWHTYWVNPGESGMATTIEWTLPKGVTAGPIRWPVPEITSEPEMTTFTLSKEAVLVIPITVAKDAKPGEAVLQGKVSWLECKESCVPASASVEARIVVGASEVASKEAPEIQKAQAAVPARSDNLAVKATWVGTPGEKGTLAIEGAQVQEFAPIDFLPYPNDGVEVSPKAKVVSGSGGAFRIEKEIKRLGAAFPAVLEGILIQTPKEGSPTALEIALELTARTSNSNASAPSSVGGTMTNSPPAAAGTGNSAIAASKAPLPLGGGETPPTLFAALLLAFLGGLILNIMPCVLPVIALKILGFVQQSKEAPHRAKTMGLLYAAGVLASFLVLAVAVLAVRASQHDVSWGMQMQNPYFRLALLTVVTMVALNLFGVFEVTLGSAATGAAAGLASQGGNAGALFNGILAVALATPCTAPFLSVALGFAFTQPGGVVLAIFLSTGLGLAFPYVLLSWKPGWLKFLPKPGNWMLRFKVAMGFPMLATAVWLLHITAPAFGDEAILPLGLLMVLVALAAWIWGAFIQSGSGRTWPSLVACVAVLAAGYFLILESELHWRNPTPAKPSTAGFVQDHPDGIEWHPWSPEAVQAARAQKLPILVDFTAKWCPTCKLNKRIAIDIPDVRDKLKSLGAKAFRADYTEKDPRITAALAQYQRAGVPMVLLYPSQPDLPAKVLPTQLSKGIVLEALGALGK